MYFGESLFLAEESVVTIFASLKSIFKKTDVKLNYTAFHSMKSNLFWGKILFKRFYSCKRKQRKYTPTCTHTQINK